MCPMVHHGKAAAGGGVEQFRSGRKEQDIEGAKIRVKEYTNIAEN